MAINQEKNPLVFITEEDDVVSAKAGCFGLCGSGSDSAARVASKFKKLKEFSEVVAGPKWKNFIRRIGKIFNHRKNNNIKNNNNYNNQFQYSPESYGLNFAGDQEQDDERLLHSFSSRFHPTDEEIIMNYLWNKVVDSKFTALAIAEADLNKCEPWDLPYKAKMGEKEWFFFYRRDRKYPSGMRTNRATESGYWKATGKDKEIFDKTPRGNKNGGCLVGMKKTLVFYKGRAPKGEKTNWVMHEYRLEGNHNLTRTVKDQWVVCRVILKNDIGISRRSQMIGGGGVELARIDSFVNHLLDDDDDVTLTLPHLTDFSNSYHGKHEAIIESNENKNNNHIPSFSIPHEPKSEMLLQQFFDSQNPNFIDTHHMNPMFYRGCVRHQQLSPSVFEYCNKFPFKNAYYNNQENFSFLLPPNNSAISNSQDTGGVSDYYGKGGNCEITSSVTERKSKTVFGEELDGVSFSPNISELDYI